MSRQGQIASYPMSGYRRGVHKSGCFHLVPFEEADDVPHNRFVPHRHDFFEIIWLAQGRGSVRCDLHTHPFEPGSLIVVSPGQVHAWELSERARGWIAGFTPEFFAMGNQRPDLLAKMPFLYPENIDPVLVLDAGEGARIESLLAQFREFVRVEAAGRDDMARGFLMILLSLARQCFARRGRLGANRPVDDCELVFHRFRLALEESPPGVVEVGEIARRMQISRSQLNESLRRAVGHSASGLIHERVVLEAKRLLVHSTLTIAEIAYELRFQDPSYFGRFFRKYTGSTPGGFREAMRRESIAS